MSSASFSVRNLHASGLLGTFQSACPGFLAGIPDDIIEKGRNYKLITEVTQEGDTFSWTQVYPTNAKVTNTFTIGKESDMETIGGKKFKVEEFTDL